MVNFPENNNPNKNKKDKKKIYKGLKIAGFVCLGLGMALIVSAIATIGLSFGDMDSNIFVIQPILDSVGFILFLAGAIMVAVGSYGNRGQINRVDTYVNGVKIDTPSPDDFSTPTTCPNCGQPLKKDSMFCTNCGAKIAVKCPICQTINEANASYCRNCGTQLKS